MIPTLTRRTGSAAGGPAGHLRRAIRPLATLAIVAIVLPFVIVAYPPLVGAEAGFVVLSGSMAPAVEAGDIVVVYDVAPTDVQAGDVITFSREGTAVPVTHRVIEVVETADDPSGVAFRTAGDANEDADPGLVVGSRLVGRVPAVTLPVVGLTLLHLPWLGHVVRFADTTPGFLLLVGVPISLFLLNEAIAVARSGGGPSPAVTPETETQASEAGPSSDGSTEPDVADAAGSTLELTPTDLTAAAAVLLVATGYTVWVAYAVRTPWSIAAAVAAIGSLLFVLALRHAAGRATIDDATGPTTGSPPPATGPTTDSPAAVTGSPDGDEGRIVRTPLPAALEGLPQIHVDSRESLLEHARVVDGVVLETPAADDDGDGHAPGPATYLPNGGVLYVAPGRVRTDDSGTTAEEPIEAAEASAPDATTDESVVDHDADHEVLANGGSPSARPSGRPEP